LWLSFLIVAITVTVAVLYVRREELGPQGIGMAALRGVSVGALLVLLVNPVRLVRTSGGSPTVLLDASLSMGAAGGAWIAALDTARALAGDDGVILRFGSRVAPFDTLPPADGASRLTEALMAAKARGGPTLVVTDGELDDWAAIPPTLLAGTEFVVLPRDTVAGAALLAVDAQPKIGRDEALRVSLVVATWGSLERDSAVIELSVAGRRLLARPIALPPSPGTARREITLPPGRLAPGRHALSVRIVASGDRQRDDDERLRVVTVSDLPAIVVIVDPADWEGRFLIESLAEVAGTTVRGYVRVTAGTWLDAASAEPVSESEMRLVTRAGGLVVARGRLGRQGGQGRQSVMSSESVPSSGPVWRWLAGNGTDSRVLSGDWYVSPRVPPSPLAGRLGRIKWDDIAPLTGLVPLAPEGDWWVALTARRGRRGVERPVLIGRDSAGVRELVTAGQGLWRWAFRGGGSLEAYRALIAAGTDWLLASSQRAAAEVFTPRPVVPRGVPLEFRRLVESVPDSVTVTFEASDTTLVRRLRFDAGGSASVILPVGTYRWTASGAADASGLAVVEPYSDELHPRGVAPVAGPVPPAFGFEERRARGRWWLFVLAIVAFAAEWAWRQRRGLP
jgi:hypothetical protein